jgi:hypothetical protein
MPILGFIKKFRKEFEAHLQANSSSGDRTNELVGIAL